MAQNAGIQDMIRRLHNAGRIATDGVDDAATKFGDELRAQLTAGRSPDGEAWKATKSGGRPLKGAAAAVQVRGVGSVILARIGGHHVYHHFGTARVPRRSILPRTGLPETLADAIRAGLTDYFRREVGG